MTTGLNYKKNNENNNNKENIEISFLNTLKNTNRNDLIFLTELLAIESVSSKEHLVRNIIIRKLEELNFVITVDDIGNISAIRGEAEVILNAHMDIVDISSYGGYSYGSSYYKGNSSYKYNQYDYILEYYSREFEFYQELAETIYETRSRHDIKEKYLKEAIKSILPHLTDLDMHELENMGCDCFCCKKSCKDAFICNNFELDTKDYSTTEKVLDMVEDYCLTAVDEFQAYYDFYEEDEEEEIVEEENSIKEPDNYEVVVDFARDRIEGKGKYRVLGGDDKCGIFIALKVAELLPDMPLKILFTVQEEIGCVGIKHFIDNKRDFFDNVRYSLTIDRREGNHLLSSQLGVFSCTNEFAANVGRQGVRAGIDVQIEKGTVADVIYIRDLVPNSINMSAGYHNPHTSSEYIVISEIDKIIEWVKNILMNV